MSAAMPATRAAHRPGPLPIPAAAHRGAHWTFITGSTCSRELGASSPAFKEATISCCRPDCFLASRQTRPFPIRSPAQPPRHRRLPARRPSPTWCFIRGQYAAASATRSIIGSFTRPAASPGAMIRSRARRSPAARSLPAPTNRHCCGGSAGRRAPASRCRSRRTGLRGLNICSAISAAAVRPFRRRRNGSIPALRYSKCGWDLIISSQVPAHPADNTASVPIGPAEDIWNVHGQTTFTEQYAPPFHAPYRGPNSLDSNSGRETADATAYLGLRLWQGAELWINPEIDQGFGLSSTLGVAGFPSGEAYKVGADYPYVRLRPDLHPADYRSRRRDAEGRCRHQPVRREPDRQPACHYGGKIQRRRHLRHQQICARSAQRLLELGDRRHRQRSTTPPSRGAIRSAPRRSGTRATGPCAAACSICQSSPTISNLIRVSSNSSGSAKSSAATICGDIPARSRVHRLSEPRPHGELRGCDRAGQHHRRSGRYRRRPPISQPRRREPESRAGDHIRTRRAFVRAGWANGDIEPYEFTDIDRTACGRACRSTASNGAGRTTPSGSPAWSTESRPSTQAFLNDGGLGILIGDGMLPHPGPEQIIETYYSFPLSFWQVTVRLSVHRQPRLQRGPRPGLGDRRASAHAVLVITNEEKPRATVHTNLCICHFRLWHDRFFWLVRSRDRGWNLHPSNGRSSEPYAAAIIFL